MKEIESLKYRLAKIDVKLRAINKEQDLHLDNVRKHFHLGTVGAAGPNTAKLNARRVHAMEKSIDRASEQIDLMRERRMLEGQIKDIESGAVEQLRAAREKIERRLRASKPGDMVMDRIYGVVEVVRANKKSLTIKCASGYSEARAYGLIGFISKETNHEH